MVHAGEGSPGVAVAPYGTFAPGFLARLALAVSRGTLLGRGKLRKLTRRSYMKLHEGPVDTTLWGVPVRLDPRTNMSEGKPLLRLDRYDAQERMVVLEALQGAVARNRDPVFIDVGANIALYSMDAVINGPPGTRAIAIEPQPAMAERIRFNIATATEAGHHRLKAIELFACAVGEVDGTVRLELTDNEHLAHVVEEGGIEVPVRPLLSVLREAKVQHVDCLKIDVEGYEGQTLGPFFKEAPDDLLPTNILIEHLHANEWPVDLFEIMTDRGYIEIRRFRANAVWQRQV